MGVFFWVPTDGLAEMCSFIWLLALFGGIYSGVCKMLSGLGNTLSPVGQTRMFTFASEGPQSGVNDVP
jgi:hypothetical protein